MRVQRERACACRSALIDDFIALGFLPAGCDRALIIPVMDRVLSPYLRGGGAAAFNFQALSQVRAPCPLTLLHSVAAHALSCIVAPILDRGVHITALDGAYLRYKFVFAGDRWVQWLTRVWGVQDLLAATLEIPFSVPPYLSLIHI